MRTIRCFLLSLLLPLTALAQVVVTVPLQSGTTLANVRYEWIASGTAGSAQSSGITQPDSTYAMFRISATPPGGAEEMIVYDNSDTTNWNTAGYRITNLDATVSSRGTSTYAGGDTSGTTTLLSRVTSGRATNLDNLDAAITSRSTYAGGDTSGTTTLLTRLPSAITLTSGKVDINDKTGFSLSTAPPTAAAIATSVWQDLTSGSDFTTTSSIGKLFTTDIDAAISSRGTSTYAGADTSGTTTLLSRLTSGRATNLDNLDAAVSSRSTYAGADTSGTTTLLSRLTSTRAGYLDNISVAPPSASTITSSVWDELLSGHTITGSAGKSLSSASAATDPWSIVLPGSYTGHQAGNILTKLDIPTATGFVAAIPSAPTSASMCRVYGYLADLNFQPVANVTVAFRLASMPAKATKIITGPVINAKTDSQGRLSDAAGNPFIDLQRNDSITPAASTYLVSCSQAGIQNKAITLAATTFDLSTAIP